MKIMHLYHSGVMIETDDKQIFIDAISDISSIVDKNKNIYFLATHNHGDHYKEMIFDFKDFGAKYILSDDIKVKEDVLFVKEKEMYEIDDLLIRTYGTTDKGVSFLIEFDGKIIYHSGDLNWWHWQNDDEVTQEKEAHDFKLEVGFIKEKDIDVMFAPVDPRLGEKYFLAGNYFISKFNVKDFIPIHFGDNFDITEKFFNDHRADNTKFHVISKRNQVIEL